MAEAAASEASDLFIDECYEEALEKYNEAINLNKSNSTYYVQRAATHMKLSNFTDAVSDANRALEIDPKSVKALNWKGKACFNLEEYATAKTAFETVNSLEPSKQTETWIRKCAAELEDEDEDEDEDEVEAPAAPPPVPTPAPAPAAPPPKYRHEWYQTADKVNISIMAKKIPEETVNTEVSGDGTNLSLTIDEGDEPPYKLDLNLYAPIDPAKTKVAVLTTKIEINLWKTKVQQWTALEGSGKPSVTQPANFSSTSLSKPSFPTSCVRKAPTDWDKLEQELKEEEADEKLEGDAALNKLFKDIYGKADEDTRRAMNKSYVESNGTVLSTNWKDIGAKYTEGSPPTGMEMKKYEQ
mmetsp:Transcript_21606/g.26023  ORF Transcript_21606/g.26023 Transcript_21606/m.26023 type:complete len:355 (+) Transcript_21606:188-1252(+)